MIITATFASFCQVVLDVAKLVPRYLIAIPIMTAIVLLSPKPLLEILGLLQFAQDYRPRIGGTFLGAFVLWCCSDTNPIIIRVRQARSANLSRQKQTQKLQSLTEHEKKILRFYKANQTKTNYLQFSDGIVNGLEAADVIFGTNKVTLADDRASYNISEFAWSYIHEHDGLLAGTDVRCDITKSELP